MGGACSDNPGEGLPDFSGTIVCPATADASLAVSCPATLTTADGTKAHGATGTEGNSGCTTAPGYYGTIMASATAAAGYTSNIEMCSAVPGGVSISCTAPGNTQVDACEPGYIFVDNTAPTPDACTPVLCRSCKWK